jgi:hypothetical protein
MSNSLGVALDKIKDRAPKMKRTILFALLFIATPCVAVAFDEEPTVLDMEKVINECKAAQTDPSKTCRCPKSRIDWANYHCDDQGGSLIDQNECINQEQHANEVIRDYNKIELGCQNGTIGSSQPQPSQKHSSTDTTDTCIYYLYRSDNKWVTRQCTEEEKAKDRELRIKAKAKTDTCHEYANRKISRSWACTSQEHLDNLVHTELCFEWNKDALSNGTPPWKCGEKEYKANVAKRDRILAAAKRRDARQAQQRELERQQEEFARQVELDRPRREAVRRQLEAEQHRYIPPVVPIPDLGYPPGCRNKANYDACAIGGRGCSAGSRAACQSVCSSLCDD